MILYQQNLVNVLRQKCDRASTRIWIASPFIGGINDIKKVIGGNWMRSFIDFKVLTDNDEGFIKLDTFNEFVQHNAEIRSLYSLHAKIYLIDNWCLITSANLTGTAFSRRYEVGTVVEDIDSIEKLFMQWWNLAIPITTIHKENGPQLVEYHDGKTFPKLCNLPPYLSHQSDSAYYLAACDQYSDFATFYKKVTGRNQDMENDGYTLFQEVDYFFNYLYHDHPLTPSNKVIQKRALTEKEREKEVRKYFKQLETYYLSNKQSWRLQRTHLIKNKLSPNNIKNINWNDISEVVKCFHCYSSYPLNRTKFLNPANNSIEIIIKKWDYLLHTGDITPDKITDVKGSLRFFGTSAIQELIGWYYPDKYPLMNTNSDCGMRFFGYGIYRRKVLI